MTKQRGAGFQKPLVGPLQPVRIAVIRTDGNVISCSCMAFGKVHKRAKVREDAAQRHVDDKHGGQAMWL